VPIKPNMKISFFIAGILLLTSSFLRSQTDRNGSQYAIIPYPPAYQFDTLNLPDWLTELYPDTVKTSYLTMNQKIIDFETLNDSITYVIYDQMSEVCTTTYLDIINGRKEIQQLEIGENCDHDLSTPSYSWKYYKLRPNNELVTFQIFESVNDSLVDQNGSMKIEYDYLEVEKNLDTTKQVFVILETGEIKKKK
jgi:hypothetical protein